MRLRFALHLAAIVLLALGVCAGVLARGARPAATGADVKRRFAAAGPCEIGGFDGSTPRVRNVPTAGLLAALPDAAEFRRVRRPETDPGSFSMIAPGSGSSSQVIVGRTAVWAAFGADGWTRADVGPAVAARLRDALVVAPGVTP